MGAVHRAGRAHAVHRENRRADVRWLTEVCWCRLRGGAQGPPITNGTWISGGCRIDAIFPVQP
jgi:hypothetical protein